MTPLDDYIRLAEHNEIESHIQRFLQRGGKIQVIPRGVSGMGDGLYGSVGVALRKNRKKKLYDDQPDSEDSTDE